MSYYTDAYESIEYGTCVECNGQVGCASDGTCDYFMSTVPQTSYQMTQYNDDSETEIADDVYALAAKMQQSTVKTLESSRTDSTSTRYVIIGALIGCTALVGLLGILDGLRFLRESKRSQIDVNSLPLNGGKARNSVIV